MTRKQLLEQAIAEAEKFLYRARLARSEISEYQKSGDTRREPNPSRKFAAAKRSSLDLSEALVALRRGK